VDTAVERKKKVVVGQRVFVDFFDRADAAVHLFRAQTLARIMLETGDIRRARLSILRESAKKMAIREGDKSDGQTARIFTI
jgi:hypothetical protein